MGAGVTHLKRERKPLVKKVKCKQEEANTQTKGGAECALTKSMKKGTA